MKKIAVILLVLMMCLGFAACGGDSGETANDEATEAPATYQSILDEYTKKIQDAVPGLLEEYNTEAAEKAGDIQALAELSNDKISKLAEISNEGIEQMAELMYDNGDEYETYEEWANKLTDVYMTESEKITNAYMDSAM